MRTTLLEKRIGKRTLRVEVSTHDGRPTASIGVHGDDGRGTWANFALRDAFDVIDALERGLQLAER
jgi:hypothetical protein